ncbi:MAG: FAD-dependent oxidoreductase [archaeon]
MNKLDVLIIGSGCAGMSCAIYSARYKRKTLIIGEKVGGLMNDAHWVENYPGYTRITGMDLIKKFKEHVDSLKVEFKDDEIVNVKKKNNGFEVKTKSGEMYSTKTVVFATGSEPRILPVEGEKEFRSKGVSYCATCDAAMFKDKMVGVVGGSDAATIEADLLAKYAKKVYIIYRGDALRAEPINIDMINKNKNIEIIYKTNITKIKGDKFMNAIELDKPYKGKKELALEGLFVTIGHTSNTELAKNLGVKMDEKAQIMTNKEAQTNVAGIFAAGDCTNNQLKQIIICAAEGVLAAFSANRYIRSTNNAKK